MADHDRLFLLTGRSTSRHQTVYTGISLTDESRDLEEEETWRAWINSSSPFPVNVVKHQVTMSHLNTSEGSMWEFDGIVMKASDARGNPAQPRQNEVSRLKCVPAADLVLPVFASGDPALKPCRDTIVMTLNVSKLIQFPDIKVHFDFSESHFGLKNSAVANELRQLETTAPEAGTVLPVEIYERSSGNSAARCVLLLQKAMGQGSFLCRLYRSDSSAQLHPGGVLRRRASLPLRNRTFISEFDIGTIEKIVESEEITAEGPNEGIVNQPAAGAVYPIECAACKRNFAAADFTPDQIQVIDLWAWYYPIEKEKSLLERAIALFQRYPGLREEVDAMRQAFHADFTKTFGDTSDPPSESAEKRFLDATANDPALRQFLRTTSCNHDRRYHSTCEHAKILRQQLNGRVVICPMCGAGPVVLRDNGAPDRD